jgi:hypothetical protein
MLATFPRSFPLSYFLTFRPPFLSSMNGLSEPDIDDDLRGGLDDNDLLICDDGRAASNNRRTKSEQYRWKMDCMNDIQ